MDFLDPKKKRAHMIRLYVGYALMTVVLGIGTLILVFAASGYDINRHTGDIIQNGLAIVDAHPEAATVFANGANKGTTQNRLILPAGQYNLALKRAGYRDWTHVINLEGSSIEQLVYPVLFPSKLVTKSIQQYDTAPTMASESPDRHWLIVQPPGSVSTFQVTDLINTKNPTTIIDLPSDTFTAAAGPHTYEAVEWSTDNTHLLLKHTFTGGSEFIMLDHDTPANSVNLNKIFPSQTFTTASLRDKKADQLYLFNATDGSLQEADTKTKIVTPVASHVLSYKTYQADTVLYATNPTASTADVEVHVLQNNQDNLLRTLPVSKTYLLEMTQFSGHFYLVAGSSADGRSYLYKDPFDSFNHHPARTPQPFRVLIVPGAQYVSFSAIARFVAVQGGSSLAVYDAETDRQFRYDTKLPLNADEQATWMDGHRLMLVSGGKVHIFDFDGTNSQSLSDGSPAYIPFFDRDYTAMFTIAPLSTDATKLVLDRTELKVLPAGSTQQ